MFLIFIILFIIITAILILIDILNDAHWIHFIADVFISALLSSLLLLMAYALIIAIALDKPTYVDTNNPKIIYNIELINDYYLYSNSTENGLQYTFFYKDKDNILNTETINEDNVKIILSDDIKVIVYNVYSKDNNLNEIIGKPLGIKYYIYIPQDLIKIE